jgi:hypothetical protein
LTKRTTANAASAPTAARKKVATTVKSVHDENPNSLQYEVNRLLMMYIYPLSPGGRYEIDDAFFMAASVSSTVSRGVVWNELNAPPALMAIATAAIETLSGASHKL